MKPRTTVDVGALLENSRLDWFHVTILLNTYLGKEILSRYPWAAMTLFQAFDEAKKSSLKRLCIIVNSAVAIPWWYDAFCKAAAVTLAEARGYQYNSFKIELAKLAIVRAFTQAANGGRAA